MSIGIFRGLQKRDQFLGKPVSIARLALPNCENHPAEDLKADFVAAVALAIPFELGQPEIGTRFGGLANSAAMSMPEATVYENCLPARREN